MSATNVLLIGHGYVGSTLAQRLAYDGFAVAAVNRTSRDDAGYPIYAGDVGVLESLQLLRSEVDFAEPGVIIHCASSGRGGVDAYRSVFLDGVRNLETLFPGVPMILTSSSSVYGQVDGEVVDESSETTPDRETSRILVESEELVRENGGIALRLAGIYGPGRSIYLQRLFEGKATIESGEVSRFLNQIHRDDIVGAILHILGQEGGTLWGQVFNVVDDTPLTQRECYEKLAAHFDVPVPPDAEPNRNRKRAWTNKIVSNAALRATGWQAQYPSYLTAVRDDDRFVRSIRDLVAKA